MAQMLNLSAAENNTILNTDLRTLLLTAKSRQAFVQGLWQQSRPLESFQPPHFESYFRYYREQCATALSDNHENVKSHHDIIEIAQKLTNPTTNPEAASLANKDEEERYWIYFAVRVLTMIDVGGLRQGLWLGQTPRLWIHGPLREFVSSCFPPPILEEKVKLEKIFNARNLERIAGIQIIWTSNIVDHLQLEDDDTSVRLFSHASVLELHRKCDVFPAGFADETLRTLSLLLPSGDKKTLRWFRREQKRCVVDELIDGNAIKCQPIKTKDRKIDNFVFWHDRLIMLKQAFDQADPKTVRQWWSDRRKPVQWYNFWFAVALLVGLTVFFGLVQSIEGAIQVYKAYHPSN